MQRNLVENQSAALAPNVLQSENDIFLLSFFLYVEKQTTFYGDKLGHET